MTSSMRKAVGSVMLLVYLTAYVVAAAMIGERFLTAPPLAQILFYALAGFLWVAPLKPLFTWMNRGG